MAETNYLKTHSVFLVEKTPKKSVVVTPPLVEDELEATENGEYLADVGKGFTKVTVNVPSLVADELSATENRTYTAPEGKGYTSVSVNVTPPASKLPSVINGTVTTLDETDFGDITKIMNSKFLNCSSLTTVVIPATVTEIQAKAFQSCSSLVSLTVKATTPPSLVASALNDVSANLVIYVPSDSVDTYKAASGWSTYASTITAIPS